MKTELINKLVSYINNNGYAIIKISTDSMFPTIKQGEYVKIEVLKNDPLIGQIIAYRKFADHITVHRLIKKIQSCGRTLYMTKGDNNKANDPYLVSRDIIVGIASKI